MKVALSDMIDLRSSALSVTIQSSLRGRIAVSLDMTDLLWEHNEPSSEYQYDTYFVDRYLVQHIPCPLNTKKLAGDPDYIRIAEIAN